MTVDVATLQSRLADARTALHKLVTGAKIVEIHHGAQNIMTFSPAEQGALRAYISELEGRLVALGALSSGGRTRARRVAF